MIVKVPKGSLCFALEKTRNLIHNPDRNWHWEAVYVKGRYDRMRLEEDIWALSLPGEVVGAIKPKPPPENYSEQIILIGKRVYLTFLR